ncbi:site-specific DNA-methyltransferase [Paracoccus sediminis]|nr:site-specific DNA-methyltransferase [Paracoccus sediminis]SNR63783.1 adenine-specific DNA-methyltransferase [Paracoccus sediminis]
MAGKYDDLTHAQLVELLEKRDRTKKLGLVWERDEIEADRAVDANFVACRIVPELSDKPAPWDNLVIEGDNFDALRWLRMTHAGRVKCIYIDPPYNTGNKDWVYNDRYMNPEDRFRQSTWLEFLYRRLTLARDLLAEDGVLLVSVNDDQRAKMEMLLDEVLPGMKIGSFVWRTRTGGNDTKGAFLSDNHEHVLSFAKPNFRFSGTEKTFELYRHWDEAKKDFYRTGGDLTKAHNRLERPNTYYPLHDSSTEIWYPCNPDSVWRYSSKIFGDEKKAIRTRYMEEFIADGYIHFPKEQRVVVWQTLSELQEAIRSGDVPSSGNARFLREDTPNLDFWVGKKVGFGTPSLKRYKKELKAPTQPLSSWITPNFEKESIPEGDFNEIVAGTNMEAAKTIKSVYGEKAFNYAKPVSLIRELVRQSTGPDDLVLDFFAGSATTAQAVMELNAEDGGNRRFIMVSSTETTEDDPDKNLCRDVTAERIRRLNASEDPKYADLAAGFAYLRTHEIAFEDLDYDLTPADAWTALEAMHDLPLTRYDPARPWNLHEGEGVALVLVDRFDPALLDWLRGRDRQNLFVYAWAPGQIAQHLDGTHVDIRPVRDTLVKRFQQ